ncbi:MAG: DUF202 domain-containing protein [Gammaproteobacteria bacterium]|nr:DUF202 domain-containing protein [Gammaproteobacteria bacterium]
MDTTNNHLANERTFLAWIRTSISIIVFGFVVAKFGIVLREFLLTQSHSIKESDTSMVIGIAFMVMGTIIALIAMIRYRITMRNIDAGQFKPANLIAILLGLFTALFGGVLVVYLILTAQSFT